MAEPAGRIAPSIRTVAILGAGERGRQFAARCLAAGFSVVLEDVLSSRLRQAEEELTPLAAREPGSFTLVSSVEDAVRSADVAVDFVPDELESKLEVFSLLDRMAPPHTILCSPTSLSIADLASCTYRPDRCLALKPFEAADNSQLTLVHAEATSPESIQTVLQWLLALRFETTVTIDEQEPQLLPR